MPDGRALSEGKEPTIPARHWAITSAGCEMMNNGEPISGRDRRPSKNTGKLMGQASPSRSEEHTSELQSLMRISYAVFCLKKNKQQKNNTNRTLIYHIPTCENTKYKTK